MSDLHNENQRSELYFARPTFVQVSPLNEGFAEVGKRLPKLDHIRDAALPLCPSKVLSECVVAFQRQVIEQFKQVVAVKRRTVQTPQGLEV